MARESVKPGDIRQLSRTREIERAIAELADRQHGVVGRSQLQDLGLGEAAIRHRRRLGRLRQLHPGAFAVGHRAISRSGHWMAAVLASAPDARLSHHTAAALWGIRGYSGGSIHVTVPQKSSSTKRIRRHLSIVPEDERAVHEGIPMTSVHRTIFDLASYGSVDDVVAMIKEAEYLNRWDRLSLPDLLERYPGKRGSRNVRFALDRITEEPPGRTRSALERRFRPFLRRHRLALPRFNDWILLGAKRFQVDCHWPPVNLIVELDGWEGHSSRSAFQDDRTRDRALKVAGYSVIHLTWAQLDSEPAQVATDLRALLGRG
jgi:very-short-patch-repair endonuclease/predicted transcriptional regulator of viral defense system